MRRAPLTMLLVIALVAGCGAGTSPPGDTEREATLPADSAGPVGTLDYDGIGEAKQGMTLAQVTEIFGEPEQTETVPGCELDSEAADSVIATWQIPGGDAALSFDEAQDELVSYTVTGDGLATAGGIAVGDPFERLSRNTDIELEPLDLGAPSTPQHGLWYLEQDTDSRLTFNIAEGEVDRILGGYTPACE